jgi:hypothetical protein
MSNLVMNGNFATGDFTSWNGDTSSPQIVLGGVFTKYALLTNGPTTGSIYQDIDTIAGSNYILSYRINQTSNAVATEAYFNATTDGYLIDGSTISTVGTFPFQTKSFTFTATNEIISNKTRLRFEFYNNPRDDPGTFGITDISVVLDSNPPTPPICFKEDTKISCLKNNIETDINIQNLRSGDLVKTFKDGYLPVNVVGKDICYNPKNNMRLKSRLFKLKKEKYPSLKEDLIVTGCHSILVSNLSSKEEEEINKEYGKIYVTDGMYRLPAYLDERSDIYKDECGEINVYHVALGENERKNYGIYANGLLVESCFIPRVKNEMTLLK